EPTLNNPLHWAPSLDIGTTRSIHLKQFDRCSVHFDECDHYSRTVADVDCRAGKHRGDNYCELASDHGFLPETDGRPRHEARLQEKPFPKPEKALHNVTPYGVTNLWIA